jgi:hydroxymethylbilane synthase
VSRRPLRLATRGSALARWQAEHVASLVTALEPSTAVELVLVQTTGDARTDAPISALGGQGVFVKEVQQAVIDGRADVAVHSAKDLPSTTAGGLALAAVPQRGDPRDALAGRALAELADGATVATGSPRRRAQLAALRPDLRFVELRGNIATRLAKVPEGGAVVVASVALERLGLLDQRADVFDPEVMVPQVGQGALAVECRADDEATQALLARLEHGPSRAAVDVERAFLAELGGGCDLPVAAHARQTRAGALRLDTFLEGPGGRWRAHVEGPVGNAIGWAREQARLARIDVAAS